MAQVGLELHPGKTLIVYCKDDDRRGSHEHERFDFLGYTFRRRLLKNKHSSPAVSILRAQARGRPAEFHATIGAYGRSGSLVAEFGAHG